MTYEEFRIGDTSKILVPKNMAIQTSVRQGPRPRSELPVGVPLSRVSTGLQRDCVQKSLAVDDRFAGECIQEMDGTGAHNIRQRVKERMI